MGTNKHGPLISRIVVPPGPGDDPRHELVALEIRRDTTTSSDPDLNESEVIIYEQSDQVAWTGTHRRYFRRLFKNGDTSYGSYEGAHRTTVKEDGSWEATWEETWKFNGGTGKFKNIKGGGTYRGKATGGQPRHKRALTSLKVKRNTNVRPSTQEVGQAAARFR
jgi:hypothetical protein